MPKDRIVEEVRRARERYAARFNFDLDAIYRDLCDRQERGEFQVVHRPPRRLRRSNKAIQPSRDKAARG
jgi:hypothetical protein